MRKFRSEVAKREGKKSEAAIGNIAEILSAAQDILAESISDKKADQTLMSEFMRSVEKKAFAKFKKQNK